MFLSISTKIKYVSPNGFHYSPQPLLDNEVSFIETSSKFKKREMAAPALGKWLVYCRNHDGSHWCISLMWVHVYGSVYWLHNLIYSLSIYFLSTVWFTWISLRIIQCSQQCRSQEQTHMPSRVLRFIFNLQIEKNKVSHSHNHSVTIILERMGIVSTAANESILAPLSKQTESFYSPHDRRCLDYFLYWWLGLAISSLACPDLAAD